MISQTEYKPEDDENDRSPQLRVFAFLCYLALVGACVLTIAYWAVIFL